MDQLDEFRFLVSSLKSEALEAREEARRKILTAEVLEQTMHRIEKAIRDNEDGDPTN